MPPFHNRKLMARMLGLVHWQRIVSGESLRQHDNADLPELVCIAVDV